MYIRLERFALLGSACIAALLSRRASALAWLPPPHVSLVLEATFYPFSLLSLILDWIVRLDQGTDEEGMPLLELVVCLLRSPPLLPSILTLGWDGDL